MNKVILLGRLTKDPEIKSTANQTAVCSFTIAVDRPFKDANGNRQTDFINCVAWRQSATILGQYFHKGNKVGIVGNIQSRDYVGNDGKKVYVTEVVVEEVHFVESNNNQNAQQQSAPAPQPINNVPVAPTPVPFETSDDVALPFEV